MCGGIIWGGWSPASAQQDIANCGSCHEAVYGEWKASMHAQAWTNPVFQADLAAQAEADREECRTCHVADAIFYYGVGEKPVARGDALDFGVNCITCHMDDFAAMRGPFGAESTGHSSEQDAVFTEGRSEALCLTCHGREETPDHNILPGYRERTGEKAEKVCVDCHMPAVTRAHSTDTMQLLEIPERPGRQHTFHGANVPEKVAGALSLSIARDGNNATVRVENSGAGHGIPGGGTKTLVIDVVARDGGGAALKTQQERVTQAEYIGPGQERSFPFVVPENTADINVRVRYQYSSRQSESDWRDVTEHTETM